MKRGNINIKTEVKTQDLNQLKNIWEQKPLINKELEILI